MFYGLLNGVHCANLFIPLSCLVCVCVFLFFSIHFCHCQSFNFVRAVHLFVFASFNVIPNGGSWFAHTVKMQLFLGVSKLKFVYTIQLISSGQTQMILIYSFTAFSSQILPEHKTMRKRNNNQIGLVFAAIFITNHNI